MIALPGEGPGSTWNRSPAWPWAAVLVLVAAVAGCRLERAGERSTCTSFASPPPSARTRIDGPIRVSPNGRYFVDRGGQPFFWLGDTAWPLLAEYPSAMAEAYLRNRALKGFTVIQTVIAWSHWGTGFERSASPMANLQGDQPWIDDDPSRPNDAYFKHVDELVRAADREGLILAMQVSWGWFVNEAQVLNAKNARPYGRWLGERYREAGNVVWVLGGDRPASGFEEVWREVAAGLREGDGGAHLVTYHPCGGRSSADYFQDATLSFDMIQTWAEWSSIYPDVLSGALRTPTRPVVHAEGAYEEGPEYPTGPITPLIVRRQAWWAVLAGGFHTYGHNQMWRLERGFERALDAPGSVQVGLMKRVLTSRDWWDLVPDEGIFASGTGSGPTLNAAARSLNGDVAIVYFSSPGTAVLHLDHIAGGRARATWISPVTGQCRAAGSYDTGNAVGNLLGRAHKRAFSVPWSWEDAVLLLEAAPG